MRSYKWILSSFCLLTALFAEKGIVVSVNDRYAEHFLPSLAHLKFNLHGRMPIEVWHSGDELSDEVKGKIGQIADVTFRDISVELDVDPKEYRGWQIKPKIMELSRFDEVLLMDADVYFFENPETLFTHPKYQETGAFFFRDRRSYTYPLFIIKDKTGSLAEQFSEKGYLRRKHFIQSIVKEPSSFMPKEALHYWQEIRPSYAHPLIAEVQESGLVLLDKKRHQRGLLEVVALNENRKVTYQYVYGDKETYWMGLEVAHEPYYMNEEAPYGLQVMRKKHAEKADHYVHIVHFVDGTLFFQQKAPIRIHGYAYFVDELTHYKRALTERELSKIAEAKYMKELFHEKKKKP